MTRSGSFYGWILVAILWVIYLINIAFPYYGAGIMNAYMAESLNMDRSILGLGFTFILLFSGLPGPLIALCLNKKGVRFTLVLGSLIIIIGALLMALVVTEGWQYVIVFGIIVGTGVGFGGGMAVQTGVTLWFSKKRALAMSIVLTSAGIGGFIAAPLLDRIIAAADGVWKAGWFFVAGMSALAALLAVFLVKNRPSDLGQVPDGIMEGEGPADSSDTKPVSAGKVYRATMDRQVGDAAKTMAFWLIIAASVSYIGPLVVFIAHGVIHLRDLGHSPAVAAVSLGLLTLCSIAGRLLAGALGDRIEPRYIWSAGLLLCMGGILLVINAATLIEMYLYAVLLGVGYGAAYICMVTIISNYYGVNSFASIMGILIPITTVASSLAPYLTGLAYDRLGSYSTAFMITAVLCLIGAVLIFFAAPPKLVGNDSPSGE